jgi:hypothetical protein
MIKVKILPPEHPRIAPTLSGLAAVHTKRERYRSAEPLLRRALSVLEKAPGPQDLDTAIALENYALVLRKTRRDSEAGAFEERSRLIRQTVRAAFASQETRTAIE